MFVYAFLCKNVQRLRRGDVRYTTVLYQITLSKHFIKALYQITLSKHFIQALYQASLYNLPIGVRCYEV